MLPVLPTEIIFRCLLKSLAVDLIQPILYYIIMFSRDDVLQSLTIVQHCLLGAGGLMPPLKGEPIPEL